MDWKKHFNEHPIIFKETEFLKQVEKTVFGQPITSAQFAAIISDIHNGLDIRSDDYILDLCCGNGIVTSEISKACRAVIGIDFSDPLINIAKKYNKPENGTYFCMSVLDQNIKRLVSNPITKIYMYEALQHFEEGDLQRILELALEISSSNPVIFLGSIPDIDKLWEFYDTDERREEYKIRKSTNQEAIGTWWSRKYIADVCLDNGLECQFLSQNPLLHSAHYRFDVRLTKQCGTNG
jgi:cyclopropane fatty-acyl-phospholipid synthase-like methyltransferase